MFSCYLAGYINDKKIKECVEWRQKIVNHYRGHSYPIEWFDPLNGKNLKAIIENGLKSQEITSKMILSGDIMSVKASDLIIANMDKFGESRDLTGTTCEMAIAWYLGKPIIMISKDPNYTEHPFLKEFASIIVGSVEELLEKKYINYFYKRVHNSQYEV